MSSRGVLTWAHNFFPPLYSLCPSPAPVLPSFFTHLSIIRRVSVGAWFCSRFLTVKGEIFLLLLGDRLWVSGKTLGALRSCPVAPQHKIEIAKQVTFQEFLIRPLLRMELLELRLPASTRISLEEAQVKAAELVPEAFRQKFHGFRKRLSQTFSDFGREKDALFDRWSQSTKVHNWEDSRDSSLLQEFKNSLKKSAFI